MAYCAPADVRQVLAPDGDASHDTATAASLSDAELLVAIADASAQVDASVGESYPTPFDPVPVLVRGLTRDVAAYLATLTYRRGNPLADDHPVALRYARARALLTDIATGRLSIEAGTVENSGAWIVNILPWETALTAGDGFGEGRTV